MRISSHNSKGFTLVEILIVIALSILLFALLLRPLISSLQYTKEAQTLAAAQDSSRKIQEMLSRELGSATYVFDNLSHPFNAVSGTTAVGNDLYTNFLDVEVPTSTKGRTVAHVYNCQLDIVLARHHNGGFLDPTTNEPISLNKASLGGSAISQGTGLEFPLAPGTAMVRYFIGLKDPEEPSSYGKGTFIARSYSNINEQLTNPNNDNNTYVLYRAQFTPYGANTKTGNSTLFQLNAANQPELDDPDFFRIVSQKDINWLSVDHHYYTGPESNAHNLRFEAWRMIAKPVITGPDIDLLVLPRDADGNVQYDANGIPSFGLLQHDPTVSAQNNTDLKTPSPDWPVVNSTINFHPGTVTSETAPATSTDYASLGVTNDATTTGMPFIPSVFTTSSKSWSLPYTVDIYPDKFNVANDSYFFTSTPSQGGFAPTAIDQPGDIVEYRQDPGAGPPVPVAVYNVTQGVSETISGSYDPFYVPLRVNPDNGTLTFALRAVPPLQSNQSIPNPTPSGWPTSSNPTEPFWYFGAADINAATVTSGIGNGAVDLTKIVDKSGNLVSPLAPSDGSLATVSQIQNAHIVPGSVRVYGPDFTTGANFGKVVNYTPTLDSAALTANHYRIDYATGIVTFPASIPTTQNNGTAADPIQIAYDYQSNLTTATTRVPGGTGQVAPGTPASAMIVTVGYQTRDSIQATIGVRVYRPGTDVAQVLSSSQQITVGNSNR